MLALACEQPVRCPAGSHKLKLTLSRIRNDLRAVRAGSEENLHSEARHTLSTKTGMLPDLTQLTNRLNFACHVRDAESSYPDHFREDFRLNGVQKAEWRRSAIHF
jgi:hypothetical protein